MHVTVNVPNYFPYLPTLCFPVLANIGNFSFDCAHAYTFSGLSCCGSRLVLLS